MDEREAFETDYALGVEHDRLTDCGDHLELVRTLELLGQLLPPAPADVLEPAAGSLAGPKSGSSY